MSNIEYQTLSHIQILNVEYRISNLIQLLIFFISNLEYIKLNQTFRSLISNRNISSTNYQTQSYIQILNRLLHCAFCKTLSLNASGMVIYVVFSLDYRAHFKSQALIGGLVQNANL